MRCRDDEVNTLLEVVATAVVVVDIDGRGGMERKE